MNPTDKMLAMFEAANASAQASTSAFGPKSSTTNVLRINMNSKDNQGTIIFIPIADLKMNPFICSVVHEVTAVWKGQDGNPNNRNRQLLEKVWYGDLTQEQSEKYDKLNADFTALYSNREMLAATDWQSYVSNQKYFGFYGWVLYHGDANGVVRKDKDGVPHNGRNGEGRLAYIQFKSTGFVNAWDGFLKQKAAIGAMPAQWVPQMFSRGEWRSVALSVTYTQDANNKFAGSITEQWFATQLTHLLNDPSTNQQAYHLTEDKLADAKDIAKELINTDIEGSLFEDQHINQFERAMRAVFNSFDYYKAHGQEAYEIYSNNFGFNELDQAAQIAAAPTTTPPPATVAIDNAVAAAQAGNPLVGGAPVSAPGVVPGVTTAPGFVMPGAPTPQPVIPGQPAPQPVAQPQVAGAPVVPPVTAPNFAMPGAPTPAPQPAVQPGAPQPAPAWGAGAPQPVVPGQPYPTQQ